MSDTQTAQKVKARQALTLAFKDRQVLAMLILGLASGLPYAAIGGTLNAWLTTVDVKPVAIGLLSWALLAYAFKFMWAAALQGQKTPFGLNIGPRRFWMGIFIILVTLGLFTLAASEPPKGLSKIALISVCVAVMSASFDIVVAAWRIEVARDGMHLDILSTVEQFGYRTASFAGGFGALIAADHFGWRVTFFGLSALMGLTLVGVIMAQRSPIAKRESEGGAAVIRQGLRLTQTQRNVATLLTMAGWLWAFYVIGTFMFNALGDPEAYSAKDFIRHQGPKVVSATVVWLGLICAALLWMDKRGAADLSIVPAQSSVLTILYRAILEPMMELIGRLRWVTILVVLVVLSYRFTDLIWGGFAYPFYLGVNYGALGHTLTEVGVASKFLGVIATIMGIALGGLAMLKFGRMPIFFIGAVLAAVTNLLFADLAMNARFTDGFLSITQLDHFIAWCGFDQRMARLISVIFAENLAVGLASAASVAYLSSIVNKEYAAVQYALLASLVMLLGVLGRPVIGQIIETDGFARAFIICAWLGAVAAVLAFIEWMRLRRHMARDKD